jgi:hypothetical protein
MAYINNPSELDKLQYQSWGGTGAAENKFNTGYSVNFQLDGQDFTFIPADVINKGFVADNQQYYFKDFLKKENLDTLKTKGQTVDLSGVSWYGDFVKDTMGRSTTGVLIPTAEANKILTTPQSYQVGSTIPKTKVPQTAIVGLSQKKDGSYVYQNEIPKGNYPGYPTKWAYNYIDNKGTVKTGGQPYKTSSGGFLGDVAKVANTIAPIALAFVPGAGPLLSAAWSAGSVIGRGGSIEDAFKAGAISYAAGTAAGAVAKPVAGVTDSAFAGTVAGGAAAGGTSAALRGDSVTTGLLTGAAGGAIAGGVNAAVDTGAGLLSGNTGGETIADAGADSTIAEAGADETIAQTGAETTGTEGNTMDDFEPSTFLNELSDDEYIYGDQEGDYPTEGNYGNPLAPGVSEAVQNFFDTNAAGQITEDSVMKAVKKFGTQVVKSFFGVGAAKGVSAGTRAALKAAGLTDAQINSLGSGSQGFLESIIGGGAGLYLSDKQRQEVLDAYNTAASRVSEAGKTAADLSKFTPFGTKTAFGESKFTYDPTTGKLTGAEYTVSPEVAAERDRLFKLASGITPTATSMADYEKQYLESQRGLLRPEQERQLGSLQERMARTGRSGFGYGQGTGMMATNPELAAYYNALATTEQTLAANAPTYARNLFGTDIANLGKLYGQAGDLEKLGAAPLTTSLDIAGKTSAAGATEGRFLTDAEKTAADLTAKGGLLSASSKTNVYNELANAAGAVGKTIDQYINDWMINNPQP